MYDRVQNRELRLSPHRELKGKELFSFQQVTLLLFHRENRSNQERTSDASQTNPRTFHSISGLPSCLGTLHLALVLWVAEIPHPQSLQSQFFPYWTVPMRIPRPLATLVRNFPPLQLLAYFCSLLWQNSLKKLHFSLPLP